MWRNWLQASIAVIGGYTDRVGLFGSAKAILFVTDQLGKPISKYRVSADMYCSIAVLAWVGRGVRGWEAGNAGMR